MRKHPSRLMAAGITPARYDELRAICRQYGELRRQLAMARAGMPAASTSRMKRWAYSGPVSSSLKVCRPKPL